MKRYVRAMFIAFAFVAMPLVGFAAMLEKFPSTDEELLTHLLENTDQVRVRVKLGTPEHSTALGNILAIVDEYEREDGTKESVTSLAHRSRSELKQYIIRRMREGVGLMVNTANPIFVGKKLRVEYDLLKKINLPENTRSLSVTLDQTNEEILKMGSDGKIVFSEDVFRVDFLEAARTGSVVNFFVPGILKVELIIEDKNGAVRETLKSTSPPEEPDWYTPRVYRDGDILTFRMFHFADPQNKRGKLTVFRRGGFEETYDWADGKLIKRVSPDLRPIKIEPQYQGFLLTIGNVKDTEQLVLDVTTQLPTRWSTLPSTVLAKATKTGTGEMTVFLDKEGSQRFFQARVEPSSIVEIR